VHNRSEASRDAHEELLEGGNATAEVVRVGDSVRKPWLPSAPSVARYLRRLRAAGVDVPEPLGRDEQGRQSVEFIRGELALDLPPMDERGLARVGGMVRHIHDASPAPSDIAGEWEVLLPCEDADLICHNDLAPWNLVVGERWAFIDWDGAGPSTRLWDLAYAAQTFALNDPSLPLAEAGARLRAFVAGYGADTALRAALPEAMALRAEAMRDHLRDAHRTGWESWATMHATGHGAHWSAVASHVRSHRERWAEELTA
jgi:tRNA A-37 threonylcarbamoyl transferase component Bud32